jgi:hypothetical protein
MRQRLALLAATIGLVAGLSPVLPSSSAAVAAPVAHLSHAEEVTAGPVTPATGAAYTFSTTISGKPIRWNPCAAIHWRFRPYGAPAGGLTVMKQAIARVAQATGTRWVYDGTTTTQPSTSYLPRSLDDNRPVLLGWTDGSHSDLLRNMPRGVLGVTRTSWFTLNQNGTTYAAIKGAVIALDRTDRLPLTGSVSWRTTILHELTHAMGLSHAGSSRQLMYPVLQRGVTDLQSGDLSGLSKVGRAAGCVTFPS